MAAKGVRWSVKRVAAWAGRLGACILRGPTGGMKKAFAYKLRPTRVQTFLLEQTLETCRRFYNASLAERRHACQEDCRLGTVSTTKPRGAPLSLSCVHDQVLHDVITRVDRAVEQFRRRRMSGKRAGYPRPRSARFFDSFSYPDWGNGVTIENGFLHLAKIGRVRLAKEPFDCQAGRPLAGIPKHCTIVRGADGWYACIVCEIEPADEKEKGGSASGELAAPPPADQSWEVGGR